MKNYLIFFSCCLILATLKVAPLLADDECQTNSDCNRSGQCCPSQFGNYCAYVCGGQETRSRPKKER